MMTTEFPSDPSGSSRGGSECNDQLGPLPPHWYAVAKDGRATLCVDEEDARQAAAEYDLSWPNGAPHRAVLMGDVAAERERWRSAAEYAAHQLEKARIWGGMEWQYNPLHPLHYRSALERLRDVLRA